MPSGAIADNLDVQPLKSVFPFYGTVGRFVLKFICGFQNIGVVAT